MKTVKILFDAGPLLGNNKSGVGYYTAGLIQALANSRDYNVELTGYYFNFLGRKKISFKGMESSKVSFKPIRFFPGIILSPLSRISGAQLPIELFIFKKYDIQLFTNFISFPSLRKTPQIITIHDLCYLDFPEYIQEKNLRYLTKLVPRSVRRASLILAVSEFTSTRIGHYFGNKNTLITPVPVVKLSATSHILGDRLKKLGLKNNSYILTLGTVEPRKNIGGLLDAYCLLQKEITDKFPLVIAGGRGWKDAHILEKIDLCKNRGYEIIQTGYISDDEKDELYKNASVFVIPSHYEGFGMPILEAMQFRTPVAASDIPVFHEVAGTGALFFDKDDPVKIASSITTLLTDSKKSKALAEKGYKNLDRFSWEANASALLSKIDQIA